jgi:hypothetical protein
MTEKIITPRLSKQSLQFRGYVKKWSKKLSVIKKKLCLMNKFSFFKL